MLHNLDCALDRRARHIVLGTGPGAITAHLLPYLVEDLTDSENASAAPRSAAETAINRRDRVTGQPGDSLRVGKYITRASIHPVLSPGIDAVNAS